MNKKGMAMVAFIKSDLFLRFMGGFLIGAVGIFLLQPDDQPALGISAIAATTSHDAAL